MVSNFLNAKIPSHIDWNSDDISVNIFSGTVTFDNLVVELRNRDSDDAHTKLNLTQLHISGLSYTQFIFNDTFEASKIELENPKIAYRSNIYSSPKKSASKGLVNLLKKIIVDEIAVVNGQFEIIDTAKEDVALSVKNFNFTLESAKTGPEIIKQKIPVEYDAYTFDGSKVMVDTGLFETLKVESITAQNDALTIAGVQLKSKFGKQELSKELKSERDHIDLEIPKILIKGFQHGFLEERFSVSIEDFIIENPILETYRDKLLPDNNMRKKLYSELLRNLPIDLFIDHLQITEGQVVYEELTNRGEPAGKIWFEKIEGDVNNIQSTSNNDSLTEIGLKSKFMGYSDLELYWSFNINDANDTFLAKGHLSNFNSDKADSFLRPNLGIATDGVIEQLYFTVTGNATKSSGHMKMKYRDFKVKVLDRNRSRINKLLSAIGNIFINDGSKNDTEGYRHGQIEVKRNTSKSFFNYLWLNVNDGMIDVLTGDGEEKD